MKAQFIDISAAGKKVFQIKKLSQQYFDTPFHFHRHCELVWIEKSFGKRIVGDHIAHFEEGDLVLMGPDLPHIWQNDESFHNSKKLKAKATVIYFSPELFSVFTDETNPLQYVQKLLERSQRGLRFKKSTNENVTAILNSITEYDGLERIMRFFQVIELLARSKNYEYLSSPSFINLYDEKDTNRINNVYRFLMQNFQRDIELKEVASICHLTPEAFCRFFKSRTNKTFTQFLNELRIGHACKLLQKEDIATAAACYQSGFNNVQNFNKAFKTLTGKTPTEYRKGCNS